MATNSKIPNVRSKKIIFLFLFVRSFEIFFCSFVRSEILFVRSFLFDRTSVRSFVKKFSRIDKENCFPTVIQASMAGKSNKVKHFILTAYLIVNLKPKILFVLIR